MLNQETGKGLIVLGGVVFLIGCLVYFEGSKLGFLGRLPGDIRIERENFNFYFPITTMILISVLINVAIRLWRYLY